MDSVHSNHQATHQVVMLDSAVLLDLEVVLLDLEVLLNSVVPLVVQATNHHHSAHHHQAIK